VRIDNLKKMAIKAKDLRSDSSDYYLDTSSSFGDIQPVFKKNLFSGEYFVLTFKFIKFLG